MWKKLLTVAGVVASMVALGVIGWTSLTGKTHHVVIATPENYRGFLYIVEDAKVRDTRPWLLWGTSTWRADSDGRVPIKDRDELTGEWHSFEAEYPSGKVIPSANYVERGPESRFRGDTAVYLFFSPVSEPSGGRYLFIGTIPEAVKNGFYFYDSQ